jgi:hypothetical protein
MDDTELLIVDMLWRHVDTAIDMNTDDAAVAQLLATQTCVLVGVIRSIQKGEHRR